MMKALSKNLHDFQRTWYNEIVEGKSSGGFLLTELVKMSLQAMISQNSPINQNKGQMALEPVCLSKMPFQDQSQI